MTCFDHVMFVCEYICVCVCMYACVRGCMHSCDWAHVSNLCVCFISTCFLHICLQAYNT
jgi:hypothetical protein